VHVDGVHIGVVIPAYNAAPWIADAIASVQGQTHRAWSLAVVNDGSTDATAEVAAGFTNTRIRLIRQANAGVSAARNAGQNSLSRAAGEGWGGGAAAFLFLDADDWLAPDALSRLAAALTAAPDAVAATGACAFVDTGAVRRPPAGDVLPRLLVRNLFVNGGHLLLRREAVERTGGFRPCIAYGEDWEFWIRIALQGPFVAVSGRAPVLFARRHAEGAYRRLAADPAAFAPCMTAIFANPALLARFGPRDLAAIRCLTEAENEWIIGRELLRHGRRTEGLARLRRSVRANPCVKRVALIAAAFALPLLPPGLHGPFRSYDSARRSL